MALRDPRFTKFKIGWHKDHGSPATGPVVYPTWYAEMGGVTVARAVLTGRSGVDDYPWDWYLTENGIFLQPHPGQTGGAADTLRSVKDHVLVALRPRGAQ